MKIIKGFFGTLGTLLLIALLTVLLFCWKCYNYVTRDVMGSPAVVIDLDNMPVNLSSTIYYRDPASGDYVEWVTLANSENRVWVDETGIPIDFENAFVSIEDQRYWTHPGIDVKRTLAAAANALSGKKIFGGSTITQQLAKNLTGDRDVTVKRKLIEMCRALRLEQTYGKKQILEWYMNIIYFGRGQYGVGTASQYYFGLDPSQLSLAQICSIVGITNNPSLYDPYSFPEHNKERQELVLDKMLELEYITASQCAAAKAEPLEFIEHTRQERTGTEVYPYYVDAVIDDVISYFHTTKGVSTEQAAVMLYYGGYDIYTCVDMDIQRKMDEFYQNPENIPKTRDGKDLQSSMVVIDPYTGDIVGLEGGVGPKTVARGLNWATSSLGRRPPGSSIKPVSTYAPAMELGLITPATRLSDVKTVRLKGTSWFPKNDGGSYHGTVSVRYGLVHSLNTIAAQVMDKLTPEASYRFLTETLHMSLEPEDKDYAPLAAGQLTLGTTTREMASAYTIFPNMGLYSQGRTFSAIYNSEGGLVCDNSPEPVQAVSEKTAYWVTDILEDAVRSGTGKGARLSNMACAGKTGTTSDAKDRWFVGYTPYYVGAVWTGYPQPARIRVSGNPAAAIWKKVMTSIHEGLEPKKFTVPEGVDIPRDYAPSPSVTPEPETPEVPAEPVEPEAVPVQGTTPEAVPETVPVQEATPAFEEPGDPGWLGVSEDVPQDAAQDVPQDTTPQDTPQDTSQETPQATPQDTPQDAPQDTPQDAPAGEDGSSDPPGWLGTWVE